MFFLPVTSNEGLEINTEIFAVGANQRIWMYISGYFIRLQRGNNSIKIQHNENNNIALLVQFRYFSTITVFADNT